MSPTYLNNVAERPESPRSPTRANIPITPGLAPPIAQGYNLGGQLTPSPEPLSTPGSSTTSLPGTVYSGYTSPGYGASPVTPRRMEVAAAVDDAALTPRKRSNSTNAEKEQQQLEKEEKQNPPSSRGENRTRTRDGRNKDGMTNPMKSFRVNLDDPCWKVLPAAMKKYDVKGREEDYRLYITYGEVGMRLSLSVSLTKNGN